MFLNQLEFQRYIQASAKRANLRVEWREGSFPHTDGNKIVLPILPAEATELDYRKQLHVATHEASHVLYTDFDILKQTNCDAMRSFLGFIWNGVEDVRIESLNAQEYEGDRANSDEVFPSLVGEGLGKLKKATKEQLEAKADILDHVLPVIWFMAQANTELYASAISVVPQIEAALSPKAEAYVQKMRDGTYFEEMRDVRAVEHPIRGTKAALELAKRIFKEVFGEDPEKELERLQQPAKPPAPSPTPKAKIPKAKANPLKPKEKKDDEGEKGKGKPEEKDEKDGDEGEGEEGKGDKADEKEKAEGEGDSGSEGSDGDDDGGDADASTGGSPDGVAEEGEIVEVAYQDFLPNSHEMKAPEDRTSFRGEHVVYATGHRGSAYNPATKDQYFVVDFCRNQYTVDGPARGSAGSDHYREMVSLVNGSGNGQAFSSQVRTRLQIRSKDKYEHGVKRGKLQQSLLHRVTVPNAPHLNEKVFKRRIVSDTLDTACIWLGDGSGSMGGVKYAQLIAASQKFNEAVGNVIGIPIEIHSFSTWQDGAGAEQPLMYVHRDFATRRLGSDELVRRMCIAGAHLANNPDGDSILWSFDRLRQSRAKRKLLIVASDGSPACCRGGDIDWYTREVVKKIEDETPIEIVGIGIMDDNVTRIYKEHYVIEDAAELEKALLALIDKKVR